MNDLPTISALSEAEARSRHARERLFATLGEVKAKLNPKTLAQDTMGNVANNVVRDTVETVRARPGAVAAAVGVAALFLTRKPLARLIWRGSKSAAATVSASLEGRASRKKGSDL